MRLDELLLADAQLDYVQLDSPLGASLQLGLLGQEHSSSAQLDPLVQPGSLGLTSLAATQLSSMQGSIALPGLMPKHASLMQLDMQPLANVLGLITQLGPLGSLALLGLTALEVLTQLCSIQGTTLLPDLVTQHASLMQLDMLPLDNASLTSMTATRFASVFMLLAEDGKPSYTSFEQFLHFFIEAYRMMLRHSGVAPSTATRFASVWIDTHRLSASKHRRPKDARLQLAAHVGGVSARLQLAAHVGWMAARMHYMQLAGGGVRVRVAIAMRIPCTGGCRLCVGYTYPSLHDAG